ncbi:ribosomal 5S rRNA E-loop binding protein Ctc/L25/TL5 [Anaeromyxobacter dehalogenans 2CP-1]|uniref:Large ribosomal subunit protein bL25 n=1 Tax=Anaeromyxobacter dehalogenans (strain ATCC BAA-258 / DSM 21875 / 2CP-1) TaxID=455488 RepID=RL25_ANAD2|nr:50S ribosomal protein L25/general stress protein Ctc [Anaeromyxobacter dehalogenans]B8J805.1 RecName: Full=Large ribosomal subunit protein bL25; AltName: Full=50S ribosomal protein L25; AltName: Full=General stress protein CTC [Anaeromyxobacter dehalogenans 2CP-1]ACL63497.1 ribosomal 5S rRNA E-loop binding protein Ctc/L25/TL5 [Anaeromyxobacter dehalogenans 2CP-1]
MAENVLSAQKRTEQGKGPARRLRQQGLIPAVVYGGKREPTHVALDPATLLKAIETPHKFNTLLELQVDGASKHVLFKDYTVDPVTRKLLHADFLEVSMDQPVKVNVPVVTVGRAAGVAEGGILSVATHAIVVEALPNKIPVRIEVDVTELKIGRSLHVSELKAPEGCKFKFQTDYVVVFVAVPEKEEVAAPVAAAVPGAAPAEGAAPAAGAAAPAGGAAPAAGAAPAKGGEAKGGDKAKK